MKSYKHKGKKEAGYEEANPKVLGMAIQVVTKGTVDMLI